VARDTNSMKRLSPGVAYRTFEELLAARPLRRRENVQTNMDVVFVGRIDGHKIGDVGYGHMGSYEAQLTVYSVEDARRR